MALVITRKCGESIMVGKDMEIKIGEFQPGRVKLVIIAPPSVPILRKEIWLETQGESEESAA